MLMNNNKYHHLVIQKPKQDSRVMLLPFGGKQEALKCRCFFWIFFIIIQAVLFIL